MKHVWEINLQISLGNLKTYKVATVFSKDVCGEECKDFVFNVHNANIKTSV